MKFNSKMNFNIARQCFSSIGIFLFVVFFSSASWGQLYPPTNCGVYSPTVTVPAEPTVLFSALGLPTTVSGTSFLINANLEIDVPTQLFNNCSFKVAAGRTIIIKNNYVRFWRCNLWSCGANWQGIDIQDLPNKSFYMTESNVENAVYGININARENVSRKMRK